jgi:hypothetical protein
MSVTIDAASGPPRIIAASIGAEPTDTTLPRGRRTGMALATRVASVQYRRPEGPPMADRTGKRNVAAAITTTATATVARIRVLTVAFTGVLLARGRAGVYHGPLPASDSCSASQG